MKNRFKIDFRLNSLLIRLKGFYSLLKNEIEPYKRGLIIYENSRSQPRIGSVQKIQYTYIRTYSVSILKKNQSSLSANKTYSRFHKVDLTLIGLGVPFGCLTVKLKKMSPHLAATFDYVATKGP